MKVLIGSSISWSDVTGDLSQQLVALVISIKSLFATQHFHDYHFKPSKKCICLDNSLSVDLKVLIIVNQWLSTVHRSLQLNENKGGN